jgi:glycosyltransferase involved in cell wall biosynthesis
MRLALLTNFIPPYRLPLLRELARRTELRVFVSARTEPNRSWPVEWGELDVVLQRSWSRARSRVHPDGFVEREMVHLPYDTIAQLRRFRPDAILAGELGARSLLASVYRSWSGCPLVIWATLSEDTEKGRGRGREWVRRALLARSTAVVVNGASGARYVTRLGVQPERIVVAGYCTDVDRFPAAQPRAAEAERRLLFVGELSERKGLGPFLVELARWQGGRTGPPPELWIAGDGPLRRRLERQAAELGVRARFLGFVAYEELPRIYGSAGIHVFPSRSDEWGLVVNEAMAAGMPVVGSVRSQAVAELVQEGVTGWAYEPDRPGAAGQALEAAFACGAGDLERMRAAARAAALAISPDFVAGRLVEAVTRVA